MGHTRFIHDPFPHLPNLYSEHPTTSDETTQPPAFFHENVLESVYRPEQVQEQFEVAVVVVELVELRRCGELAPVLRHDPAELGHALNQQPQQVIEVDNDVQQEAEEG